MTSPHKKLFIIFSQCAASNGVFNGVDHDAQEAGQYGHNPDANYPWHDAPIYSPEYKSYYEYTSSSSYPHLGESPSPMIYSQYGSYPHSYSYPITHFDNPEHIMPQIGVDDSSFHESTSASYSSYPELQPYQDPQGYEYSYNYNSPQQYHMNDLLDQVHSTEPSHDGHSSDPTPTQCQSASFDNHDFATLPQASNGVTKRFNPWDCDFSETPLLPYHFIATLHYPCTHKKDSNTHLYQTIITAFRRSDYHFLALDAQTLGKESNPARDLELGSEKGFLIRLCLRNVAFLLSLNPDLDELILEETKNTLDWIHGIIYSRSECKNDSDLFIAEIVQKHLNKEYIPGPAEVIVHRKLMQVIRQEVPEYQAKEALVILLVLENYYKSINLNKWDEIFGNETFTDELLFVKYYMRLTTFQYARTTKSKVDEHKEKLKGNSLLPWKEETPKLGLLNLPPRDSILNNGRWGSILFTRLHSAQIITSYVDHSGPKWEELEHHPKDVYQIKKYTGIRKNQYTKG